MRNMHRALSASCLALSIMTISVNAQANKNFQYDKSLSVSEAEKSSIWKPDEIETPSVNAGGTKSLETVSDPVIQEYSLASPKGTIVVSQLWDASCGAKLCPTKIYLKKTDGSVQVLNDGDMMPQLDVVKDKGAYKSLDVANPQISISQNGNSVEFKTAENQTQSFDLNFGVK